MTERKSRRRNEVERPKTRLAAVAVTFALVVAACSGDASPTPPTEPASGGPTTSVVSGSESGIQAPSTSPAASGTATLTVGAETWTFADILCLLDDAEPEPDSLVSKVEIFTADNDDGLHLSATVLAAATIGEVHEVRLVGNDGEPIWFADNRMISPNPDAGFIVVQDSRVTADAIFFQSEDQLSSSPDAGTPGRFEANCG